MAQQRGNLKPAHTGYRYQDISTAYFLIKALVDGYDSVTVDKKQVEDDRIDDLEVCISGRRVRRQIKSSSDASRRLVRSDFTSAGSSLRIDRLVLTHKRSISPVEEYRLCATWQPPDNQGDLIELIERVQADQTFDNTMPVIFRLKADQIWPLDGEPVYDTTDSESKERSISSIMETLTPEEQKELSTMIAAVYLVPNFGRDISKEEATANLDKELNGKTADEILAIIDKKNEESKNIMKKLRKENGR